MKEIELSRIVHLICENVLLVKSTGVVRVSRPTS